MGKEEFSYILFDQNIITCREKLSSDLCCVLRLFSYSNRKGSIEVSAFAHDSNPLKVNLVHIVCGFFLGSPFPYSQNAV